MALAITSYTPTTGPVTGGTQCTITGTELDTVDTVLVGSVAATIVGTPTGTTLVFRTPPGAAGTSLVTVVDNGSGGRVAVAGTSFTYTAVPANDTLVSTMASKFRLDCMTAPGISSRTKVRGITTIKPGVDASTEDDSDIDSGTWGADFVNGRKWSITGTVRRGLGVVSGVYDTGQEGLRLAADNVGTTSGLVVVQWYDRTGGPEAYQGTALVTWSPQGGNKTSDKVDFTLLGQGARTTITNPVIADPTLAS